ncbi:hypothetical protein BofuT4_P111480.1 [Botrytis cinerea T4]|uniref:Uncharacterized protein n=1 Tax=Botryotinia fuckeliana (strain T4) TaxID=999810 RepID=G2Y683_BOTF4|nr:hypothetical protein BofuT4_P111480.1 [Botrytis cinerea T4]
MNASRVLWPKRFMCDDRPPKVARAFSTRTINGVRIRRTFLIIIIKFDGYPAKEAGCRTENPAQNGWIYTKPGVCRLIRKKRRSKIRESILSYLEDFNSGIA